MRIKMVLSALALISLPLLDALSASAQTIQTVAGGGRRQASCRINGFIYAASFMMFCGLKCFSPLVSISSGFR